LPVLSVADRVPAPHKKGKEKTKKKHKKKKKRKSLPWKKVGRVL
jgi:hypothetical protein